MSSQENKAIARRWSEDLWSKGELAVADEIVAPTYVRHDPGDPFIAEGPAGVKRLVMGLRAQMPDLHITIEDVIAEGNKVVTRYTGTGTVTGEFMGRAFTGKQIRVSAIQIFRMVDGKIVESWANRDDLGLMQQLGVVSRSGPVSQ
jgi:steroid delta-isomerase-like uncharacterized protein